ncbi:hypothetical protein C7271_17845 [filamentous cyanobacterium CCP5]|nr:hypothetical protein C7271_17845 [filamentous cyanobacterium CCP5]
MGLVRDSNLQRLFSFQLFMSCFLRESMDFMGFFWVASLLSSYASTTPQWEQLEETVSTAIHEDAIADFSDRSDRPESGVDRLSPLIASLSKTFSPSFDWDMWEAIPEVAVVSITDSSTAYQPPSSCFPTPQLAEQPRYQVWLHDRLIGETTEPEAAQQVVQGLRRLLTTEPFDPQAVQPLITDSYAAVGLDKNIVFVIDDGFGVEANQHKLAAVYWTNNLRQAFDLPPVDLAIAQMATLGITATDQQFSGTASWYGPYFHGRITATGETFNQYHLTAAHPSLPFGTYLKVRNQLNDKTVVVRVNDRGPYIGDRSLDLSYAAAQCLGSEVVGVIPYEATILKAGTAQQWVAKSP